MNQRPLVRGIFSTANGKYAYRETRASVRPIFREDSCFEKDVEEMALALRQEFSQECKLMTASNASHVDHYFDDVDIQMHSHAFLFQVLIRIVIYNFEEARKRVQDYVDRVFWNPLRYERLGFDDSEDEVFFEDERSLVGYDNTLPAALTILKQRRFPGAFSAVTSHHVPGSQGRWVQNSSHGPISTPDSGVPAHLPPDPGQASEFRLPNSELHDLKSLKWRTQRSGEAKHYQNLPGLDLTEIAKSDPSLPFSSSTSTSSPAKTGSTGPRGYQSMPIKQGADEITNRSHVDSKVVNRQGSPGASRPWLEYGHHLAQRPHPTQRKGFKGSRPFNEVQHSAWSTSAGPRRQDGVSNAQGLSPSLYHFHGAPNRSLPCQPTFIQHRRNYQHIPDRLEPSGFGNTLPPSGEQASSFGIDTYNVSQALVPYYPRAEDRREQSEKSEGKRRHHATKSGNLSRPRVITNPFPSAILESESPAIQSIVRASQLTPEQASRLKHIPFGFGLRGGDAFDARSSGRDSNFGINTQNHRTEYRDWDGDQLETYSLHHSRNIREQEQQNHSLSLLRHDCILFISGLPEHLGANALRQMLRPVRGLKWIAPLKRSRQEGGQFFTNLVFHEPTFAAEALELLPQTQFTAMNGRYLTVRPFQSNRVESTKHWYSNLPNRDAKFVPRDRRSSESTTPRHIQIASSELSPRNQGLLTSSMTKEYVQDDDTLAQETRAVQHVIITSGHANAPETGQTSYRVLQKNGAPAMQVSLRSPIDAGTGTFQASRSPLSEAPNGSLKMAGDSTATSAGSPVKRAKRKGSKPVRSGKQDSEYLADLNPHQLSTMLGLELQDLAMEAAEASGHRVSNKEASSGSGALKSFPGRLDALAKPSGTSIREKQEIPSQVVAVTDKALDDQAQDPIKSMEDSDAHLPIHATRTELHSIKSVKNQDGCVDPNVSPIAHWKLGSSMGAILPDQNPSSSLRIDNNVLQRRLPEHRNMDRTNSDPIRLSRSFVDVREQQVAAQTSQRQFAVELIRAQLKANDSKQTMELPHSSNDSTEQRPLIGTQIAEKSNESKPELNEIVPRPQDPGSHLSSDDPGPPSLILAKSPQPTKTGAVKINRQKDSSKKASWSRRQGSSGSVKSAGFSSSAATTEKEDSNLCKVDEGSTNTSVAAVEPGLAGKSLRREAGTTRSKITPRNQALNVTNCTISRAQSEEPPSNQPCDRNDVGIDPPRQLSDLAAPDMRNTQAGCENGESEQGDRKGPAILPEKLTADPSCTGNPAPKNNTNSRPGKDSRETNRLKPSLVLPNPIISKPSSPLPPVPTRKKKEKKASRTTGKQSVLDVPPSSRSDDVQETVEEHSVGKACESRIEDLHDQSYAPGPNHTSPHVESVSRQEEQNQISDSQSQDQEPLLESVPEASDVALSMRDSDLSSTPIESPPENGIEDSEALRNSSTRSLPFVTPATSPQADGSSLTERTSINSPVLVKQDVKVSKDVSSNKSNNNRKKNRPGKKSKSASKASVEPKPPKSSVVIVDLETGSSGLLDDNCLNLGSLDTCIPDKEVVNNAPILLMRVDTTLDVQKVDAKETRPISTYSLGHNANKNRIDGDHRIGPDGLDANMDLEKWKTDSTLEEPSTWNQDDCLIRAAREAGYADNTSSVSLTCAGPLSLEPFDESFRKSSLVIELRSRCGHSAMQRIRELCGLEKHEPNVTRATTPIHRIADLQVQTHTDYVVMATSELYSGNGSKDSAAHLLSDRSLYGKVSDESERVLALDAELHEVVREAVQMIVSFASDKEEVESGNFCTLDSIRAERVLAVAGFRETSPLDVGQDRDVNWTSEWCDEVIHWLRFSVPRLTEMQKSTMCEWEKANPSLQQNLMALGFTVDAINQCGLIWTPQIHDLSPHPAHGGQNSNDSKKVFASTFIRTDASTSSDSTEDTQKDEVAEEHLATSASDPTVGLSNVRPETVKVVKYRPESATDTSAQLDGEPAKEQRQVEEMTSPQKESSGSSDTSVDLSDGIEVSSTKLEFKQESTCSTTKGPVPLAIAEHDQNRLPSAIMSVSQELCTAKPSYASALQSPSLKSSDQKPSYAKALQTSGPKSVESQRTDAWALPGEEAWGSASNKNQEESQGRGGPGEGSGTGGGAMRMRNYAQGRGSLRRGKAKD